jgi:hypothetical protein
VGALVFVLGFMRGSIVVRLQGESEVEDKYLSLAITKSPTPPAVTDMAAHIEAVKSAGHKTEELSATLVEHLTEFPRVAAGQWYVHLYGVYTRGRTQRLVRGETFTRELHVGRRKTIFVDFSLEAIAAEFLVTVFDDKVAIPGAKVWVDDDIAHAVATGKNGLAIVEVPRGKHVIRIKAKGLDIERPFEVVKLKAHELPINLVWERRVDDVSRALENSGEYKAITAGADLPQASASSDEEVIPEVEAEASGELPSATAEAPADEDGGISLADMGLGAPPEDDPAQELTAVDAETVGPEDEAPSR